MSALRFAARRLGGALLQRTQPAVAEEGRRLVPSRFMRSRQLSTQCEREIQEKKVELRDLVSKTMQKKLELQDALAKAGKNSEFIAEHDNHAFQYIVPEPHDTPWYRSCKQFAARAGNVLDKVAKTTVSVMIAACLVSIATDSSVTDEEVKAHTVKQGESVVNENC